MEETMRHARVLSGKSITSLVESKRTITAALRDQIDAARDRENAAFGRLMGTAANIEALSALAERREPDFRAIDLAEG